MQAKNTVRRAVTRAFAKVASAMAIGAAFAAFPATSFAAFPEKPITIIVPFTAGGSTDVLARLIAKPMQAVLKQPVVVENKVGAAGAIGAAAVAKSPADGYTIVFGGVGTNIVSPLTVPETPYDPQKDFAPVGQVCTVEYVLVVNANSPIKTFGDLVARAKQNKGAVSYMSTGNKGPLHLGMEYFSKLAGVNMVHVPYKGEAAALPDVISSRVDVGMMTVPFTVPLINDGKLRALAAIGGKRSALLPNVPTVSESGYPSYELPIWIGLSVPAGTPADRIELLNKAMREALKDEDVKKRMLTLGVTAVGSTPAEFAAFLEKERTRWVTMIKSTGALEK
ncbi:Bug family tripartite tricarboxylate transporter substrate binding protein [Lacisediminimonas profundi]|uniref:Bug family tripartite tricarboxylate transporter substrate binding protein n=1 Tax=Lacisediminimonas profundi TaxID=2603856 RepID=UPI00124B66B4|nr:tripartite tricarboxylate transporter substrate binding protein [Lacisediminimonas profundi]